MSEDQYTRGRSETDWEPQRIKKDKSAGSVQSRQQPRDRERKKKVLSPNLYLCTSAMEVPCNFSHATMCLAFLPLSLPLCLFQALSWGSTVCSSSNIQLQEYENKSKRRGAAGLQNVPTASWDNEEGKNQPSVSFVPLTNAFSLICMFTVLNKQDFS